MWTVCQNEDTLYMVRAIPVKHEWKALFFLKTDGIFKHMQTVLFESLIIIFYLFALNNNMMLYIFSTKIDTTTHHYRKHSKQQLRIINR